MTKKTFGVSVVSALTLVGSFACFPVFADSSVNIDIVEVADDGSGNLNPWVDIAGAMPGETYSAIPRIKNSGVAAASVRMCLAESGIDVMGSEIELDNGTFTIEINDSYWTKDAGDDNSGSVSSPIDVCYKYNTELAAGEMTEPLFYEVALSSDLRNEHSNATFSLHLYAEAAGDLPESDTAANPDTGVNTNSEPLTVAGYVSLSAGLVILVGMIIYLLSKKAQKR